MAPGTKSGPPRKSRRLRMGSSLAVGNFETKITQKQWQAIENAYGQDVKFDDNDQILICRQLKLYLEFEAYERNSAFVDDSRILLSGYREKSKQFHALLTTWPDLDSPAIAAMLCVRQHIIYALIRSLPSPIDIFNFTEMLDCFLVACDRAQEFLEAEIAYGSFEEGDAWQALVCSLTSFARERGLPTGAAKDSDKRNEPSPFVRFILALMTTLPEAAQRHAHSWQACAQAISVARRTALKRERIAPAKTK